MSSHPKFLDLCLEGKAVLDDIDDFVDQWHETPQGNELHDYLGMTKEEYSLWLRAPDALPYIIKARREVKPLKEAVAYACQNLRRTGQSSDKSKISRLQTWLKAKGELI
jgi:hypothetical protein